MVDSPRHQLQQIKRFQVVYPGVAANECDVDFSVDGAKDFFDLRGAVPRER